MFRLLAFLLVLLCSCNTYKNVKSYLEPTHRTLWEVCWDEDGDILLPSDTWPHAPRCDNPEYLVWPNGQVRLHVAESAKPHLEPWADTAIKQWNIWLGKEFFVKTEFAYDVMMIYGGPHPYAAGWTMLQKEAGVLVGGIVLFDVSDAYKYEVILHEMGHILGLAHDVDDKRGYLMSPGATTQGTQIAPEDIKALRNLYI